MTTYNGDKYLNDQLDSILNQTLQDFELIICDDCSTDNTRTILTEYAKKDIRIKIFFNEQNLGFKKNFEKAASLCKGDYIAFSDQDDVWELTKLQESIDCIGDNILLCSNSLEVDSNLNSLGYTLKEGLGITKIPTDNIQILQNLIHHNFVQGSTIIAKKDFIHSNIPIPEEVQFHDWYFGLLAATDNSLFYLDTITLKYRQHANNQTSNRKRTLINYFKPTHFSTTKAFKDINEKLFYIDLEIKKTESSELISYLQESKEYYKSLLNNKFSSLKYLNKYYNFIYWQPGYIQKILTLNKSFWRLIILHLLNKLKFI